MQKKKGNKIKSVLPVVILFLVFGAVCSSFGTWYYFNKYHAHASGWFNVPWNFIVVKTEFLSLQEMESVSYHEMGHQIWFYRINDTKRDEYESLYIKYNNSNSSWCSSSESIEEDFADDWSDYRYHGFPFFDCEDKIDYFDSVLDDIGLKEGWIVPVSTS